MYEEDINFDEEFDEDDDEAFLNILREASDRALEKGIVSITNTQKETIAKGAREVFRQLFADRKDVKVYIEDGEPPLPGMPRLAYVCVEGKNLSVLKPKWLAGVAELGDNFEVCAKMDGTIVLSVGIGVDEVHILDGGNE